MGSFEMLMVGFEGGEGGMITEAEKLSSLYFHISQFHPAP